MAKKHTHPTSNDKQQNKNSKTGTGSAAVNTSKNHSDNKFEIAEELAFTELISK